MNRSVLPCPLLMRLRVAPVWLADWCNGLGDSAAGRHRLCPSISARARHSAELAKSAPVAKRRREVVLALPNAPALTPVSRISRLTPELAALYADKTPKTITRDIHALQEAGLIVRQGTGVRPFIERMLAFLPPCNRPQDLAEDGLPSAAAG